MTLRFEVLADDAWLIHLGTTADAATSAHVHAIAARIRAAAPAWLRDLVPTYTSLGVFFDSSIDADSARAWLSAQCRANIDTTASPSRIVEIPVCYGGVHGEDLDAAATELGIAPGFPYLSGLDPTLALPRLATPRTRVPAGSIAIGGAQTGIYPRESPGGWRLLGRTPLRLFDAQRDPPSLLAPGDRVRFVAIDADTFARSEREA